MTRMWIGCLVSDASQRGVCNGMEMVGGIKSALFGGEGLFFAILRGPSHLWLQSLPFSRLAGRMLTSAPRGGQSGKEGSILGKLFGGGR